MDYANIDKAPEERERGITNQHCTREYQLQRDTMLNVDCPGHADYVKT